MSNKSGVILFSGTGSNLENLLKNKSNLDGKLIYKAAFTNNPSAKGLVICQKYSLDAVKSESNSLNSDLSNFLEKYDPDLIILSGYMKILPVDITKKYEGKIINIHPSLLPKYPGLDTHEKAISNNDEFHGATVHYVNEWMDDGPIILQGLFKLHNENDIDKIKNLVHKVEHIIFPIVVKWIAHDIVKLKGDAVYINGNRINSSIKYIIND